MSIFRLPKLDHITSRFDGLRGRLGRKARRDAAHMKTRRLQIDPLEERQLLSVSPADWSDILVNEVVSNDRQEIDQSQSVAVDDDGDFVVVWTRYNEVRDAGGNPVIDPETGLIMRDANIYGRYFTDEVQRITLPDGLLTDDVAGQYGSFTLTYGGNEVQKLTISATYQPQQGQANVAGTIELRFDGTNVSYNYNEDLGIQTNADNLQADLRGIGGALADVVVSPINAKEFRIEFGDLSLGADQSQITVESVNFTSGFLPAATVETLREPIEIGPIFVSPDDPHLTATSIKENFRLTTQDHHMGPIDFPPPERINNEDGNSEGPLWQPQTERFAVPGVSVRPVINVVTQPDGTLSYEPSLTEFEITFDEGRGTTEGSSGKKDHPELVFSLANDETGAPVDLSTSNVETLVQTSPEFRVNPDEPENPFTPLPDKYDQTNAVVAIDADGDFVVAWESEIPDSDSPGSISDIFARQFAPTGLSDPLGVNLVPGVRAMGDAFLVNAATAHAQGDPTVGMDDDGNFTVAWFSSAQDISFFGSVLARSFSRHGEALGDQFLVNMEDTSIHFEPYVAVSHDGNIAVTWTTTDDEDYIAGSGYVASVEGRVFDPAGNELLPQFNVGGGGGSSAAFDKANNLLVTWHGVFDTDSIGASSMGVQAVMREVFDDQGNVSGAVIRETFRVNSASFNPSEEATAWPLGQSNPTVGLDADGDLVIGYQGFGPDVSDDVFVSSWFYADAMNDLANADLWPFFSFSVFDDVDVDTGIELALIDAANSGASMEQLGRIRQILDSRAGLLRGEANGILFSRFDADPNVGPDNILYSDSIANAQRDGHNQRHLITISTESVDGSITVRLSHPGIAGHEDIEIEPVYENDALVVSGNDGTQGAIESALRDADRTGINWWHDRYEGPIEVRVVSSGFDSVSQEILDREVAPDPARPNWRPWRYTNFADPVNDLLHQAVYEVTFQGEVHDTGMGLSLHLNDLEFEDAPEGSPPPDAWVLEYQDATFGIRQSDPTIGMETDGDFVMTWIQQEESWNQQNVYYRRFDEDHDHAGPNVTDLVDDQGNRVDPDGIITGPISHIVLTFDEPLMTGDPDVNLDSALNQNNYTILRNGVEIPFGVVKAEYGLNRASELNGQDDGFGRIYDLDQTPTNKFEVVLSLDANGSLEAGTPEVGLGEYIIRINSPLPSTGISGIRDEAGNPLGAVGLLPSGSRAERTFKVVVNAPDEVVDTGVVGTIFNGILDPVTPGAVAVDADGDQVVVWTAYDSGLGHDRVFMRMFDTDGSPADLPRLDAGGNIIGMVVDAAPVLPVTPLNLHPEFENDVQRHPNVAIDPDGDFIVTWTNYAGGDGGDADIYARRFNSLGEIIGVNDDTTLEFKDDATITRAFRVNTYTDSHQQWSDVAMDLEGDFVVTWSSHAQEADGQLGTGYGIYARMYDAAGQPLAPEFQANVTTQGDQQSGSVAMAADGEFVIAWTSDQNGIGDDIVAREFYADGSPKGGPLGGERIVNDIVAGDQRYPDVSMRLDGDAYIVTWTDSNADVSGTSVWAALSAPQPKRYSDFEEHSIYQNHSFTINVGDNFLIDDIEVQLGFLGHLRLEDLEVRLRSPSGTEVVLFDDLPRPLLDGSRPPGNEMFATIFDDEAPTSVRIFQSDMGAVPPYIGTFVPQQVFQPFIGENSQGTWTLIVNDRQPGNNLTGILDAISTDIGSWNLDLTELNPSPESFQVNSTTQGHQMYSSVAMDYAGNFLVTWSGKGSQPMEVDDSGYGVFRQRYNRGGTRIGGETRINNNLDGDQWISSIASDARGNYVVVWTGVGDLPDTTSVYKFDSVRSGLRADNLGPLVSDVVFQGDRVIEGDVIPVGASGVSELTVVFNENLNVDGGNDGLHSVLNSDNWLVVHNDVEIVGAVIDVVFELNPATDKYEATITFDGNGISYGTPGLPEGDYVLTVRDLITDVSVFYDPDADPGEELTFGNALDGDVDGVPGSRPMSLGFGGYQHRFAVGNTAQVGAEFRINQETGYQQLFSDPGGTGYAREESNRNVAVDHDGDFVVVWTSYGQDDAADSQGGGVFVRMFDRNDVALTDEIQVNQNAAGHQRNASVAIDADGEFVVVWESEATSADGSWDVFARRYDSMGRPLGDEFRVNTTVTQNQLSPAVAMDDFGNFVVIWATAGQDFSFFNDVYGQLFDSLGNRQGLEFLVNTGDLPGVAPPPNGRFEISPAVSMSGPLGTFAVAWEVVTAQQNGVATDTVIAGRQFDQDGTPLGPEMRIDTGVGSGGGDTFRVARNPQLTSDDQGGFLLVWEAYSGDPVDGYNVFYRQFNDAGAGGATGQVNMTQFANHQVNPSVGIDADGDFAIVWNGTGGQPDPLDPDNADLFGDMDDDGVFIRSYHADSQPVSVQSRVNHTVAGIQNFPSIGVEPDGDSVVVWSGRGVGDAHGIFARRYDEATDTAGPLVSDLLSPSGTRIPEGSQVTETLTHLIVVFDEEMMTSGPGSVTNLANYRLLRDGTNQSSAIAEIHFGLNQSFIEGLPGAIITNKWEAVMVLDGTTPLEDGNYELMIINTVRDRVGNPLGSTGFLPEGASITRTFSLFDLGAGGVGAGDGETRVNVDRGDEFTYPHATQAVASDADGDTVTVWANETPGVEGIYAQLTAVVWTEVDGDRVSTRTDLGEIRVTADTTARSPSVARDGDGDFVVTWSQQSALTDWDVYARRYDAVGNPLGAAFQVNDETADIQQFSSVAMDIDGDFVIAWQSLGQDGDGYGIYAQRFSSAGDLLGGVSEVQVMTFVGNPTGTFRLGFEGNVTGTIAYGGNPFAVADVIQAQLIAIGADVEVSAAGLGGITIRFVGADGLRDREQITVVDPVLAGDPGARISIATQSDGFSGEFRVNDTTANDQAFPCIAMDAGGAFVVTWTGFGQNGDAPLESNIYAKQFVGNAAFQDSGGTFGFANYDSNGLSQQFPDANFAVSSDDPANHVVLAGAGFDGVAQLVSIYGTGSGSLLQTGRHILTAAHVVDSGGGVPVTSIDVVFDLPGGATTMTATQILIHPDWNGDIFAANDLAIIILPGEAPLGATRYDIYRGSSELGHEVEMLGYGVAGQGSEQFYDGQKRIEYNVFEVFGEELNGLSTADFSMGPGTFDVPSGKVLVYDFDSGLATNDALGGAIGRTDLGLGTREGSSSHGDSGGPSFLNGVIVGIVSGGAEYTPADSDAIPFNVSYGTIGLHTRASAYANWIDMVSQATGPEFLVNMDVTGADPVDNQSNSQNWSTVAMDADGDFVITWTSYSDAGTGDGSMEGVFARRYDPGTSPVSDPFQVNTTTESQQQFSRIAMDADGDFIITWESFHEYSVASGDTDFGILAQRYARNELLSLPAGSSLDPSGKIGGEFRVNVTRDGDQRYPGIAMNDTGDCVIVWSGNGDQPDHEDIQGIFRQRFEQKLDDAGPTVTNVHSVVVSGGVVMVEQLLENADCEQDVTSIVVTFGENLDEIGGVIGTNSVLNPNNWQLTRDGQVLFGGVSSIEFGLNQAFESGLAAIPSGKYEAVILLDDDMTEGGAQPLAYGSYVLTAKDAIRDIFGNRLDGDFDGTPGDPFSRRFTVAGANAVPPPPGTPGPGDTDNIANQATDGDQSNPAVAQTADGSYVTVWISSHPDTLGNIYARQFDRFGNAVGGEFQVSSYTTGLQSEPDVAVDGFGNFVVVWAGEGEEDTSGVYARVFDAFGRASGSQFRVHDTLNGVQDDPSVAMDPNGNFVVTWRSYDQGGIMARGFAASGVARTDEFLVNTIVGSFLGHQQSDVAMDANGNFTVVWSADQDAGGMAVIGRRFTAGGASLGGEFQVNTYENSNQEDPQIAMDHAGNFVVAWASFLQDGSGWGVYGQRYNAAGARRGGEFRVNEHTSDWQYQPGVAMCGSNGNFAVTWSGYGQEVDDPATYGVFSRMYNADGSDFVLPGAAGPLREFRVNAITEGNQSNPAIAMDSTFGHYVVAWEAVLPTFVVDPITGEIVGVYSSNIYARSIDPPADAAAGPDTLELTGTPGDDLFGFVAGADPGSRRVSVNGTIYAVDPAVTSITFDGGGGNDTVLITGSAAVENAKLWAGEVLFTGADYTVHTTNVEDVGVVGGLEDNAELHDTNANDTLTVDFEAGQMVLTDGSTYRNQIEGFGNAHAYARSSVIDPAVNDHDQAIFLDSVKKDTLKLKPDEVRLINTMYGYNYRAKFFETVTVDASRGGSDVARIWDSSGNDTVTATYREIAIQSADGSYDATANGFEKAFIYATTGGCDTANLFDSAENDVFQGKFHKSVFNHRTQEIVDGESQWVLTPWLTARAFDHVHAHAVNGGVDKAWIWTTPLDDHFEAGFVDDNTWARLLMNVKRDENGVVLRDAAGDVSYGKSIEVDGFYRVGPHNYDTSDIDTKHTPEFSTLDFLLMTGQWIDDDLS